MHRLFFTAAFFASTLGLGAQQAATSPQAVPASTPAPAHQTPKPSVEPAPGGGPDKVWVNLNSSKYHCPGDRYYGKTANGRYMTEGAAKSAGAKGPGGRNCFGSK